MNHRILASSIWYLSLLCLHGEGQANPLVIYEFKAQGPKESAAAPTQASAGGHSEGFPAEWVIPSADKGVGFGGKVSSAYLNGALASRVADPEKYLTFTVRATPGYRLNLETLSFSFGGDTTANYEGGPFPVRVSVLSEREENGRVQLSENLPFLPDGKKEADVMVEPVPAREPVFRRVEVDLSGAQFHAREAVTFRLFIYYPGRSSLVHLRIRDIAVNGTVVAKEGL